MPVFRPVAALRRRREWSVGLLVGVGAVESSTTAVAVGLLLLIAAGLVAIRPLILYLTTEMAVTNRRIIAKQDLMRRNTLEMLIRAVGVVEVDQCIVDGIMVRGSITITDAGARLNSFVVIAGPLDFRRPTLEMVDHCQGPRRC